MTMTKKTVEYLEQLQIEEDRKPFKQLLLQPTRVQLGTKVTIAGIETFKVEYELTGAISLDEIDKMKEETGLTALFITLVNDFTTETEDVDGQSDGYGGYNYTTVVTHAELDTEYLYTYY